MYHTHEMYDSADRAGSITIRPATERDAEALTRLAQRDSAPVPVGATLLALDGGEIRAAVAVETSEAIADPFHPTAAMVRMLRLRLGQLRGDGRGPVPGRRWAASTPGLRDAVRAVR